MCVYRVEILNKSHMKTLAYYHFLMLLKSLTRISKKEKKKNQVNYFGIYTFLRISRIFSVKIHKKFRNYSFM